MASHPQEFKTMANGMDKIFEVTLSLDTNAYADGDVLAATHDIEEVFRCPSGYGYLMGLTVLDKDDQAGALDIVFLRSNVSIGTENAAVSVSDANADEIITVVEFAAADYVDLVGSQIAIKNPSDTGMGVLLVPDGTDSLFVAAISRDTKTYSASGITLKIGLLRN